MSWSFPIASFAGTQVRIHVTFFLLLAWVGISAYLQGGTGAAIFGITFILALFLCVVLHEFGHVLTAKAFGIETPDITLLPIGGVARLKRLPREPVQELLVALAGPAVNVVIAAGLFLALRAGGVPLTIDLEMESARGFFLSLMVVNIWLVLFNMIPAFPMDGGRVFRALLATVLPYSRATSIAAGVGQALALAGVFFGFMNQWWLLVFVALFIFLGAGAEASASRLREATRGFSVSDAMMTRFQTLRENEPISRAVDLLLDGAQADFPIVDDEGRLSGMLLRQDLIAAVRQHGEEAPVIRARSACDERVPPDLDLTEGLQILHGSACPTLPVMEGDRLLGLINSENIGELLMVRAAMDKRGNRGGPDAGDRSAAGRQLLGG